MLTWLFFNVTYYKKIILCHYVVTEKAWGEVGLVPVESPDRSRQILVSQGIVEIGEHRTQMEDDVLSGWAPQVMLVHLEGVSATWVV